MYRMIVVCANWSVNLGRLDAHFYVSTMGRYNSAPRKGHIGDMLRIVGYIKHHMVLWSICDTICLEDQGEVDIELSLSELYPDAVD